MRQQDLYARLELLSPDFSPTERPRTAQAVRTWRPLKDYLGQIGQSLLNAFCGSMEPRILIRQRGNGTAHYRVYDPFAQRHYAFDSEAELRVWLDQRYYQ